MNRIEILAKINGSKVMMDLAKFYLSKRKAVGLDEAAKAIGVTKPTVKENRRKLVNQGFEFIEEHGGGNRKLYKFKQFRQNKKQMANVGFGPVGAWAVALGVADPSILK